MADRSSEARYLPALAVMLLLVLGITGWWIYELTWTPANSNAGAATAEQALATANAASIQSRRALAGEIEGFDGLDKAGASLAGMGMEGLSAQQQESVRAMRR